MALVLVPVCILAAWDDAPEGGAWHKGYFALLLVLLPFMIGVFAATDVFLFYVFFEAMLIPVYFLIGMYGGARRQAAARSEADAAGQASPGVLRTLPSGVAVPRRVLTWQPEQD